MAVVNCCKKPDDQQLLAKHMHAGKSAIAGMGSKKHIGTCHVRAYHNLTSTQINQLPWHAKKLAKANDIADKAARAAVEAVAPPKEVYIATKREIKTSEAIIRTIAATLVVLPKDN